LRPAVLFATCRSVREKALFSASRRVAAARVAAALLIAAAALSFPTGAARAHEGGELIAAPRPSAPPGDGAKAEQLLKEIEPRAAGDPKTAKVVSTSVENAKKSLERGHGARASGDQAHAAMLFSLALEWAETARDVERAAAVEHVAGTIAKSASDAATQVDRARALLEETQARRGRALAELSKVEAEAKGAEMLASEAEQERLEAGKRGGKVVPDKKGGDAKRPKEDKKSVDAPKSQGATKGAP
jgi:hypothetical protein